MKRLILVLVVIIECGFAMGAWPERVRDTVGGCMPPRNLHGMTTDDGALVEWSFINEEYDLPISHFNVYRSSTSAIHDFECIARVPAEQGVSEYHYLDPIHEGLQFYRVRAFHEGEGLVCESIDAPRPSLEQYLPLDMNFESGNWQFYDFWEYYGSSLGYEVMELNWMDFFWGIKLTALRMQQYTDQYLTRFAIYDPEEGPGNYTIMIYKGGEDAPERCVMQQDFTLHGTNKWHCENLTEPVDVTPENTWVIITAHHVERPAAVYEDHLGGLKNGRWISPDGINWYDMSDYFGHYLNFMVRVRVSSLDGVEEEIVLDDAQVYPNPTTGVLHIEASGLKGVEVYDMMGRQVASESIIPTDAKEIDLSRCPSGVYLVKLITDEGVATRRVSVNK